MTKESAQVIKEFLHTNRITISEFARVTDLSRWSIYKYLKGGNIQPKAARKMEQKILEEYRVFLPHEKLLK